MTESDKNTLSGYWYKDTVYWCTVCGNEEHERRRIYDRPKPVEREDRYEDRSYYCGCLDWYIYGL